MELEELLLTSSLSLKTSKGSIINVTLTLPLKHCSRLPVTLGHQTLLVWTKYQSSNLIDFDSTISKWEHRHVALGSTSIRAGALRLFSFGLSHIWKALVLGHLIVSEGFFLTEGLLTTRFLNYQPCGGYLLPLLTWDFGYRWLLNESASLFLVRLFHLLVSSHCISLLDHLMLF